MKLVTVIVNALVHVSLVKTPNDGRMWRCYQLCTMFSNCNTNKGEREALKGIDAAKANTALGRNDLTNFNKNGIADAYVAYFNTDINYNAIFK